MSQLLTLLILAGLIQAGSLQSEKEPVPVSSKPAEASVSRWKKPPVHKPISQTSHSNHAYCWTQWFDRDDASGSGDWELLLNLRNEYPGKICSNPMGIQAETLSGQTSTEAGDFVEINKDTGFVCKNQDQKDGKCNDYRVRFSCPFPFCAEEVCWTRWFDRDDPSGTGDWETLKELREECPTEICEKPKYIEVVTVDTNTPVTLTGQEFDTINPVVGFVCKNNDQKKGMCRDYKVRFGCCCD